MTNAFGKNRKSKPMENRYTRFWSKVEVKSDDECWRWHGATIQNGYGQIGRGSVIKYAHRVSYELSKGPIPEGLYVCHSCDNKWCVNPAHLWVGTAADNSRDAISKGLHPRSGGRKRLDSKTVHELRTGQAKPLEVAKRLGMSDTGVYQARMGKTWKRVYPPFPTYELPNCAARAEA
jgi:hypothetical protein